MTEEQRERWLLEIGRQLRSSSARYARTERLPASDERRQAGFAKHLTRWEELCEEAAAIRAHPIEDGPAAPPAAGPPPAADSP
jgi:hypothetical protein